MLLLLQVVTVLYIWVKKRTSKEEGAVLTIRMGFYGQCGALLGPLTQMVLVWLGVFGAPPHHETQLACDDIAGNEYVTDSSGNVVSTVPPPGGGLGAPVDTGYGGGGGGSGSMSALLADDHASCLYY